MMMQQQPEYFVFTGRERVPDHITHVLICLALNFVPADAFYEHPNIEEVICHDGVLKVEQEAFYNCPRLKRVIMRGVNVVEKWAFYGCKSLTYIECGKLEIIRERAFQLCKSLNSINLPSIKIVEMNAFGYCTNLKNAKFGKELETVEYKAFVCSDSLERITLPLKDGMIIDDTIFRACEKLNRVDLVGGALLNEAIAALLLEEWQDDMNEKIESISRILPNTRDWGDNTGEKAKAIRTWITTVLCKFVDYKAKHRSILNDAAAALQPALPNDVVLKNILPFLELPSHTFERVLEEG